MRVPIDGNPRPVRASYTAPHLFGMVGPGNQHRNTALGFSSGIIRERDWNAREMAEVRNGGSGSFVQKGIPKSSSRFQQVIDPT